MVLRLLKTLLILQFVIISQSKSVRRDFQPSSESEEDDQEDFALSSEEEDSPSSEELKVDLSKKFNTNKIVRFVLNLKDEEIGQTERQKNGQGTHLISTALMDGCPISPHHFKRDGHGGRRVQRRECRAPLCSQHSDCNPQNQQRKSPSSHIIQTRNNSSTPSVCCFNGCVKTCLKMDPPRPFDWVEETEFGDEVSAGVKKNKKERGMLERKSGQFPGENKKLLEAEGKAETVLLKGGCKLNQFQYQNLILFTRNQHVHSCNCSNGEVLCEVKTENPE